MSYPMDDQREDDGLVQRSGYQEDRVVAGSMDFLRDHIASTTSRRSRRESEAREQPVEDAPAPEIEDATQEAAQHAVAVQTAQEHQTEAAEQAVSHEADSSASAEHAGHHGGGGSSSAASSSSDSSGAGTAISATTDMGDSAHVGGTGVVSAASTDNLQSDDPDDDEQQAQLRRMQNLRQEQQRLQQAEVQRENADSTFAEDSHALIDEPASQGAVQPRDSHTPSQRLIIRRGEPIRDAAVAKQVKFSFDESRTKQLSAFPVSLEQLLRDDLATMTNEEFAEEVSLPSLVAAFVAAQLGALVTDESRVQLDANTSVALDAFRQLDHRTGAVEDGLAELTRQAQSIEEHAAATMQTLVAYAEKSRLMENALAFLVSETVDPTSFSSMTPRQAVSTVLDGKYRQVRDGLRHVTEVERRDEAIAKGRPIR